MLLFKPMETLHQSADCCEGRRLRAWELHQQGWKQKDIATAVGVTLGAVSHWMTRGRAGGRAALPPESARRSGSLACRAAYKTAVFTGQGRRSVGFRGDIWTPARVAAVIKREFGVAYPPDHVGRLLRDMGWNVQNRSSAPPTQ
jgi:transposase